MAEEDYRTPPQFSYINDLIANLIQLNDGIANYRVSPKPATRRWLLSSMAALYMKVRPKIVAQNEKDKHVHKYEKGTYEDVVTVMDLYIKDQTEPGHQLLIKVAMQLNEWVDQTGATSLQLDRQPTPSNKAVKDRFR